MRIGFLLFRRGYIKCFGSIITAALERGHDPVIIITPNFDNKPGEQFTNADLLRIWSGAQIFIYDISNPASLSGSGCDAMVGIDLVETIRSDVNHALDDARRHGVRLYSVSYLFETTVRNPNYAHALERVFYLSDYQRQLHLSLFPEAFGQLGSEWVAYRMVVAGCTNMDQLRGVDNQAVRERYQLPDTTPVVLFMSLKMNVPDPWRQTVWRDSNRLSRILRALLRRRPDLAREVWSSPSYRTVCQKIRTFCDRQGAALVIKSRPKNQDPPWLKELADVFIGEDDFEYPYISLQLLAVSSLCVHFESGAIFESAFAGVPSLSITVPQEHLYRISPVLSAYLRVFRSKTHNSIFNYPGIAYSVDYRQAPEVLRNATFSDFPADQDARKRYVTTFLGFDDTNSAERILSAIEADFTSRRGMQNEDQQ